MNFIFTIFEVILVVVIIIGFIGYVITTNRIIKSQEREISELHAELTGYKRIARHTTNSQDIKFGDD